MKKYLLLLVCGLALASAPAHAQRKTKVKVKTGEAGSAANRLLPLFGGLSVEAAQQLAGPAFLADIDRNFPSRTEASKFFSTKGYEYLTENQADTALYRFNLAWLLDQKNADAYRGLGVIASRNPTPDESISLLLQGLTVAPTNALMLSDLGTSYLIRYGQTKKKKDLDQAQQQLEKALAADPNNAYTWQQMARVHYLREDYAKAWEAVHKGQSLNVSSLDLDLVSDLSAKLPDPQGMFK
ncbi:tetratricopeptide repeat protein [Hymenobacter chitinivorans]|uniref:Tetratricopeptide repeat protein n=1 Tax=Hymenobacter chitinivorans DSM 11115 TaxID=1121954 RepID=A0A2M9B545_9BACT|nr:tetratricopeptide repeat protein [Hymenobacter chitinivorans]PJJ53063.1 tetratricopeptide repeat protein [Hymenobacter chitinivorans DSM 11115]